MPEQEPQYFKEFRKHIDKRFDEQDKFIVKVVENAVDELAVITLKNFDRVDASIWKINDRLDGMDGQLRKVEHDIARIDKNIEKIEGHIGRYEVRTQKIERVVFA